MFAGNANGGTIKTLRRNGIGRPRNPCPGDEVLELDSVRNKEAKETMG
jgi:hypothetical protein